MKVQNSQADTLGILLWVYAAIQSVFALMIVLVLVIYGISGVMMFLQGGSDVAFGALIMGIFIVIYILMLAIGFASIYLNIKAGKQLRNSEPASKNVVIASAIGNFLSFMCGGICLAPFGIALGIYGLVFVFSDNGKMYFEGRSNYPISMNPPPATSYYDLSGNLVNRNDQNK